jgi:hypothetical protein
MKKDGSFMKAIFFAALLVAVSAGASSAVRSQESAASYPNRPANTNSVLFKVRGKIECTAAGLKQIGPRILGFQKPSKVKGGHPRSFHKTDRSVIRH